MKLRGNLIKDGKWWVATVPAVEVASQGKTQAEAIMMVMDAMALLIEDMSEEHIKLEAQKLPGKEFLVSTMTPTPIICLMLRNIRKKTGVSVRGLAKSVGTKGANTVFQFERGKHEPSISKLQSLMNALGRDIEINIVDR